MKLRREHLEAAVGQPKQKPREDEKAKNHIFLLHCVSEFERRRDFTYFTYVIEDRLHNSDEGKKLNTEDVVISKSP